MTDDPGRAADPVQDRESEAERRVEELGTPTPVPPAVITDVFTALDKAIRSRRLYQANNPVLHTFLATARRAFAELWPDLPSLTLAVEEHAFRWYGQRFFASTSRDSLPFLFYKDGIRFITFLPGFEDELELFLDVVNRARSLDPLSQDDMVTLLWQQEFSSFRYSYVDALSEGLQVPQGAAPKLLNLDITLTMQDAAGTLAAAAQPPAVEAGQPTVAGLINREDFAETLYFLEPAELEQLGAEVELEWSRPVKADVLHALFDRLEDGLPGWKTEILAVLRQMLPLYLAEGDLASATVVLVELGRVLEAGALEQDYREAVEALYRELSEPGVLTQLLRSMEEGAIDPAGSELAVFLRHLGPAAMPVLLAAMERTEVVAVRTRLREASEELAAAHADQLVRLLRSPDAAVVRGAARLIGQVGIVAGTPLLVTLMASPDVELRRTVAESLVRIRNAAALDALQKALEDEDREVRITAARGLATLRYAPARERLEKLLGTRHMRDADLTEKMAFFEAYGAVANEGSVGILDRLLNGRRMLAREGPEMRACAAMAL
ncbi:MAG TPA: HEAT repeat domain-containing protein, partial [Longimicrobiales bacterium]|nr:HEAT repeat domain-containing protein [Longimicrobiales bacterium]